LNARGQVQHDEIAFRKFAYPPQAGDLLCRDHRGRTDVERLNLPTTRHADRGRSLTDHTYQVIDQLNGMFASAQALADERSKLRLKVDNFLNSVRAA
jgi:hypothetical protein